MAAAVKEISLLIDIIVIIIKQLVTRHMSVKNKLTNRICGSQNKIDNKIAMQFPTCKEQ